MSAVLAKRAPQRVFAKQDHTPEYYGLFEDNDQKKRLMAIANYNTNLAEYWQVADAGFFPIAAANNAFKLGINYILYGLTH
jgi:hypothetical protein